ncbi:MAG: dimethyl sulfoxide reductase anchor subunit [Bacteroidales bacterium]|jgi:anaerobic dimethyl sulfoxide reductase subunit B (iron-sulfur subunit)|nr:dimethyl sulfoxide reductase anchor subunit [Bacteroidales bacterium]
MRKGFIFDHGRCTGCNACAAACVLENKWTVRPRTILSTNINVIPALPLTNLSIACNHCEKAVCLEGCPTGAISRDNLSSSVLIDGIKCLGCHYCQWNCPYDAPKYDESLGITGKCTFCNTLLNENLPPACSSACPTGALSFGIIPDRIEGGSPVWFPVHLNPALHLAGNYSLPPLRIEPKSRFSENHEAEKENKGRVMPEWSLIVFTFLASMAVAAAISSAVTGSGINGLHLVILLGAAMLASLFHLGKPLRSWRALVNIKSSPLSREILAYIAFSMLSLAAAFFESPYINLAAAASGVALVILIDWVYHYSSQGINTVFNSGQAFLTALLTASFIAGETIAFLFLAALRILLSARYLVRDNNIPALAALRVFRILVLLLTSSALLLVSGVSDRLFVLFFLLGELSDRILFYSDFKPVKLEDQIKVFNLWQGKT